MTNLADLVREAAAGRPDHPAVVTRAGQLTWSQVDERVDRAARALVDRGFARGSRIAMMIGNRPEFVVTYFGILRAGMVAMPLNTSLTVHEITRLLGDAGTVMLVHDRHGQKAAAAAARRMPDLAVVPVDSPEGQELVGAVPTGRGAFAGPRLRGSDLAVLLYTSGSEGQPKGVMLSHGALRANVEALARLRKPPALTADDRLLIVLPLFHIYGLNAALALAAKVGATVVLMERFEARAGLGVVRDLGVTAVAGAPPMYVAWSAEGSLRESMDGVRMLISGASALPSSVFQQFQTITGLPIWEGYGLTECSPVVATTLVSGRARPGSVGRPVAGVQVSLRDSAGQEVDEGDPGELWVRGKSLLSGYWPGAQALDDQGWLHTGDLAILDEDGDYRLVDRRLDLIIVSGFNVYPREVEAVLATHPAVAEVAVVGAPHPLTGETVKAVVVVHKGVPEPTDLRAFSETRLARFKCPTIIEFAPKLPRASTGKVTRAKLRGRA